MVLTESDSSGMEITSLHKANEVTQLTSCVIDGIGELRSSWIGQKGVCKLVSWKGEGLN